MHFYAANQARPSTPIAGTTRKRSSRGGDALALLCAAALLLLTLWFRRSELLHYGIYLALPLSTSLGFAIAALILRGVSVSGALAGAAVAFIMASYDLGIFWTLLTVFCVTLVATRIGVSRKRGLSVAEAEAGRSASQIIANLLVATLVLAVPGFPSPSLLAIAALAELTADTLSSELGTAFSVNTVLITTWKAVPAGTDGGVTFLGTFAGILGAAIPAGFAALLGLLQWPAAVLVFIAGIGGMLVDSILGATLERAGYLNNDFVNLLSTAGAAIIAWMLK